VAPAQARYLDVLGREVLTEVQALSSTNGWRRQRTVFNNRGLVQYRSIPYFSTQTTPTCSAPSSNCTWFAYDIRDRVTLEDRPDAGYLNTAYAGAAGSVTVTSTDTINTGVTRVKRAVFNVLGQLTQTIDAFGTGLATTTSYDYDSHGNLDNVIVGSVQMAAMSYNLAGYRTSLTDANTGAWTFTFDTLGNLTRSVDAKAQDTRYTYDLLNRPTQRVDLYGTTSAVTNTWNWDTLNGTGQLESRSRPGFTETYTYRAADSKLQSVATAINISMVHSGNYTRTFGYDTQGRLSTMSYPSGSTFSYAYNARGYLTQLKSGATVLENVLGTDAFGSPTETTFANGLTTVRGYQPATGRITSIQTGPVGVPTSIQDLEYTWRANSTLYKRIDHRNTSTTADDYVDTFSYNALEQLTSQVTSGGASRTLSFAYSSWGNLTSKTSNVGPDLDVTGYTYGTAGKPHRLTAVTIRGVSNTLSYDGNGNITTYNAASGDDTFLVYDGRNRVTRITVGATTGTSTPTARDEFWYDPDGQRFLGKEWWDDGGTQKQARMVYLGNFEEVIPAAGSPYNLVQRTDLSSSVRHIRTRTTAGTFATRFEYVYRDLLGSVDVVTNSAGVKLNAKLSFDAFGGRRQETWGSDITASAMTTILANEDERFARGFTDHEMLNRTGFVHMNGRVYDPRIGRFVSPDPIVQFPTFSQSYNRYAYVFNSPMSFTDPSGLALVSVTIDGKGGISVSGPAGVIRSIASAIAGAFEKIRQVLSKGGGGNAAAVGFGTTVGVGSRIGGPAGGHSKQGGGAGGGTTGGGSQEEKPDTSWSGVANEALQGRLRVRGNRIFGSIRIAAEDPGTTDNLDDFIAQANQYLNGRRVVDDGVAYRSDIRLVRSSQENADISLGSFFVGHPKDHLFVDAIGGRRIFMHNNGYWPDASTPAHEVGHLLGLPHQPHGANSLMRQHPLEGRALSASDIRELISVYR
jgi:RHS repeat-associated protein